METRCHSGALSLLVLVLVSTTVHGAVSSLSVRPSYSKDELYRYRYDGTSAVEQDLSLKTAADVSYIIHDEAVGYRLCSCHALM